MDLEYFGPRKKGFIKTIVHEDSVNIVGKTLDFSREFYMDYDGPMFPLPKFEDLTREGFSELLPKFETTESKKVEREAENFFRAYL